MIFIALQVINRKCDKWKLTTTVPRYINVVKSQLCVASTVKVKHLFMIYEVDVVSRCFERSSLFRVSQMLMDCAWFVFGRSPTTGGCLASKKKT